MRTEFKSTKNISSEYEQYVASIQSFKLLTKEQEINLALKVKEGDTDARNEFINANLKLVVKIANTFSQFNLPMMDLIQAGNLGLIQAVEKFDPSLGYRFSTYATNWIKVKINDFVYDHISIIKIPQESRNLLKKINIAKQALIETNGKNPTNDQIVGYLKKEYGIVTEVDKITNLQLMPFKTFSLDKENEGDMGFDEIIPDNSNTSPSDYVNSELTNKILSEFLNSLEERNKIIFTLRFGLKENKKHTLQEIGVMLGITKERVRQLCNKCIYELKTKYGDTLLDLLKNM